MNRLYKYLAPVVIISLFIFILPNLAQAQISRISSQDATATGTTSVTAMYAATPSTNDLLVAIIWSDSGTGGLTTVPSGWSLATDSSGGSGDLYFYYEVAPTSQPTTITFGDTSASNMILTIYEYTGNVTVSPLDKTQVNSSGISSVLSQSTGTTAATSQANELAVAAAHWTSGTQTLSSWSNGYVALSSSIGSRMFTSQLIFSFIGTQQTTITVTGTSATVLAGIVTFKAAPGPFHALVYIQASKILINKGITVIN